MYIYGFRYEIIEGICVCVYENSGLLSSIIKLGWNDVIKDFLSYIHDKYIFFLFQRMIDIIPKLENVTVDNPVYLNTTTINNFNSTTLYTNNTDYEQGLMSF